MRHTPRVVIVDDHPVFRQGLRRALESQAWAGEIVEAGSVAEAMQVVQDDDVVAMDIFLPDGDGIVAARDLMQRCPSVRVIIVTMSDDRGHFDRAVAAGIQGYVVKNADPETMVKALHTVVSGGTFLDPLPVEVATLPPSASLPPPFDKLTSRERAILARVVDGQPSKQIARELGIKQQYVKNTLTRIYDKLGVKGRMGASRLMREKGIDKID